MAKNSTWHHNNWALLLIFSYYYTNKHYTVQHVHFSGDLLSVWVGVDRVVVCDLLH